MSPSYSIVTTMFFFFIKFSLYFLFQFKTSLRQNCSRRSRTSWLQQLTQFRGQTSLPPQRNGKNQRLILVFDSNIRMHLNISAAGVIVGLFSIGVCVFKALQFGKLRHSFLSIRMYMQNSQHNYEIYLLWLQRFR